MSAASVASPALVGISHGTSSPDGRIAIAGLMDAVAEALPDLVTLSGFVDVQQPDVAHTLVALDDSARAIVVPLLLSAGYHVHVDLHEAVRDWPGSATLAQTLGPDPRLAEVQHERLQEVGYAAADILIVAGAGSSDTRAVAACRTAAELLAERVGRPARIGFLSAASPTLAESIDAARAEHPRARIVVSSYLLAPGYFQSIVENAGADAVTEPLIASGRPAPKLLVDIVCDRYSAALLYSAAPVLTSV
jgi:sirohydrochlorin ferrochelatase